MVYVYKGPQLEYSTWLILSLLLILQQYGWWNYENWGQELF